MLAILFAGALAIDGDLAGDEVEEGAVALGEVGRLGGPVVHLDVDVGVVVGAPRRGVGVVPKALEIRREVAGA